VRPSRHPTTLPKLSRACLHRVPGLRSETRSVADHYQWDKIRRPGKGAMTIRKTVWVSSASIALPGPHRLHLLGIVHTGIRVNDERRDLDKVWVCMIACTTLLRSRRLRESTCYEHYLPPRKNPFCSLSFWFLLRYNTYSRYHAYGFFSRLFDTTVLERGY
jgi:hypothetical protein